MKKKIILLSVLLIGCGDGEVVTGTDASVADTSREHAVFDAYGYQLDHDVKDGLVLGDADAE